MRTRRRIWSGMRSGICSAIGAPLRGTVGVHFERAKPRRELVEHAVHVLVTVGAAVSLRELHRLVDDDSIRHLDLPQKLVSRDEKYAALDRGEPGEVAVESGRDERFELLRALDRSVEERPEVRDVALVERF